MNPQTGTGDIAARLFSDRVPPPWAPAEPYDKKGEVAGGACAFTADSRLLIVNNGPVLSIRDFETGNEVARVRTTDKHRSQFACSASGWLAVVSQYAYDEYDISSPLPGQEIRKKGGERTSMASIIPIPFFDFFAGTKYKAEMRCLAWSPDGRFCVLCTGGKITAHFPPGTQRAPLGRKFRISKFDWPTAAAFSPDGRFLAVHARQKQYGRGLYLLDQVDIVNNQARTHFAFDRPLLLSDELTESRISFSPDSRRVLLVNSFWARPGFPVKQERVFLADTETGAALPVPEIVKDADKDHPVDFAWQPDGNIGGLFNHGGRRYGCLLEGASGKLLRYAEDAESAWTAWMPWREWLTPPMTSNFAARSPDGRRFAITGKQGVIQLYQFA